MYVNAPLYLCWLSLSVGACLTYIARYRCGFTRKIPWFASTGPAVGTKQSPASGQRQGSTCEVCHWSERNIASGVDEFCSNTATHDSRTKRADNRDKQHPISESACMIRVLASTEEHSVSEHIVTLPAKQGRISRLAQRRTSKSLEGAISVLWQAPARAERPRTRESGQELNQERNLCPRILSDPRRITNHWQHVPQ